MHAVSSITGAAALAVASVAGVAWQRRNGRFRDARPATVAAGGEDAGGPHRGAGEETAMPEVAERPVLAELGWVAGTPLTLVQFSSAFCAPCRATRVLCEQAAATVPGVSHLEVDAESHLGAVRGLGILRTPTVLLVDASGRIVQRASGQPTRAQLLGAIGRVLGEFTTAG
ncbi:MAG: thioredoxin family protein [Hamadaea sp.]|nr:thioredoxin family protein [Hamadaea sp.]